MKIISIITNLKRIILFVTALALSCSVMLADMSDNEVLSYIKQASGAGKSQQQIEKELAVRGVSTAQLQRVKDLYEKRTDTSAHHNNATSAPSVSNDDLETGVEFFVDDDGEGVMERVTPDYDNDPVYGRGLFRGRRPVFQPNTNIATPEDYRLGPGDEVVINIWGDNEATIRDYITPEGNIMISNIGPVSLSGMTIKEANNYLKNVFARKYSGIEAEESDIALTLGNMRTIQVDIMGEVRTPGTYRLSPFSTLFHALYNAGGTNSAGSLRDISIYRNGKKIASADVYEYLLNGKSSGDIRLQEGDVIIIPTYSKIVNFENGVKRPMSYELKSDETLEDAIRYAGGLNGKVYNDMLNILRTTGEGLTVLTIEADQYQGTPLFDGDIIEFGSRINRFDNRIEISGSVFRPGVYELSENTNTIKKLVDKASGLTEDAFTGRVLIYRESDDLSQIIESVDLNGIMNGSSPDFALQPNDLIVIPSILDIMPKGDLIINGAVSQPGSYPYAAGITVEDLILRAGGLKEGASDVKVDISRRIIDSGSISVGSQIAETYTVTLKDGLGVEGDKGFILQPNDIVDVRFSPSFMTQRRVYIRGEVTFPGSYTLNNREERISALVKQAGGLTAYAYSNGASLRRQFTEEEIRVREEARRFARANADEEMVVENQIFNVNYYTVGIDLEAALVNPGGTADLVLQPGDELFIPELMNTVKIAGAVLFPNSVTYTPGKKLGYYINQAGGYNNDAQKKSTFVVYMNGQVAKGKGAKIEPGCQIVVPEKEKKDNSLNIQKWLSIGTSAASLATMAASIVNLIK